MFRGWEQIIPRFRRRAHSPCTDLENKVMAQQFTRRRMLRSSLAGAAGAGLVGLTSPSLGVLGANERIRVATAGINGQGYGHLGRLASMENVEVIYVIDPDSRLFESRIKAVADKSKGRSNPKGVQDVRKALEDKSLDAVSIATPNHWHALITIWACQAGKDVYVEKPMSHNIHEGRIAVETARKYKRVVQHGTQSRSDKGWAQVAALVKSGKLGKLKISRGLCYKAGSDRTTRGDIGFAPVKTPPSELDFNIWMGPAKNLEYHENLVHYRWHNFYATGNGDLGNQGVHQMDIARWVIPGATLPRSVVTFGGRLGAFDQADAANTEVSIMDFGDTQLIFEARGLPSPEFLGAAVGNILHFEEGMIVNKKWFPKGSDKAQPLPEVEVTRGPGEDHFGNWIAAIRSRNTADLNAEILEGHYSAALCHLANMSVRLGKKVPFQPTATFFENNENAAEAYGRTVEYLKANKIDTGKSGYVMGRRLVVDAQAERIVDDAEANALLTRDYRKGLEVPDRVA
jgi:predicted dehydrogenase